MLKKVFLPLIFSLALFFSITPALAFTEQSYDSSLINSSTPQTGGYKTQRYEFVNSGLVNKITLVISTTTADCWKGNCEPTLTNSGGGVLEFFDSPVTTTINGIHYGTWTGSGYTVSAGTHYMVYVAESGVRALGSATPSTTYQNADDWDTFCTGGGQTNCNAGYWDMDLWMGFNMNLPGPTSTYAIQFSTTPTSTTDFSTWATSISLPDYYSSAALNDYNIVIQWGSSDVGRYINDYKDTLTYLIDPFSLSPYVLQTQTLAKVDPLLPGTYTAQAFLYPDHQITSSTPLASSTVWTFTITSGATTSYPGTNQYPGTPTANTSTADASSLAQCNYAWPVNKICELAWSIFVPSPSSWSQFVLIKDKLALKVPFGYYSVYSSALQGVEIATSTTSTLSTDSHNADLETSLTSFSGMFIITMARDWIFTPLLYLAVAAYIYHRFKNFQF